MQSIYNNYRFAINDPIHINKNIWTNDVVEKIQTEVESRLEKHQGVKKRIIVPEDQIKNVMDSITESNPRKGSDEVIEMIISYIVGYISNEYELQNKPKYDAAVTKYDGSFGIVSMSSGQLGIRKKGLNQIGRMF